MQRDISLLTVENYHHPEALDGLNYSFSDYSDGFNSTKRSGNTQRQKQRKFTRKKQRASAQKLRNNIKSIEKIDKSNCSTTKDEVNQSKVEVFGKKQKNAVETTFKNMYNLEHRNKDAPSKSFFGKQNPKKPKLNATVKQRKRKNYLESGIKYYPMADVLNYKEKPLTNQILIQRRLFNKIQQETSYY